MRHLNAVRLALAIMIALSASPVLRAQTTAEPENLRRTWVVDVVQRTKDAVVNISAEKIVPRRGLGFFLELDRATSLGSGFIIHPDGYVVTNNHVVDRARKITVELADGRKLPATLVSCDSQADLAILKISDPKPLPVLELGDSSDLMIGEPTVAVGNPFGYSHTVSTGIVSALHRDAGLPNSGLTDLIQTDAAINPGNSGGPLLDAYGKVIGIDSAIRAGAENIGFAIPIDRLRDLIPALMNPGLVNKVEMPIRLTELRTLTPPDDVACRVVHADDPSKVAVEIDGHKPSNIIDAYAILLRARAGRRLTIVWEDGHTQAIDPRAVPLPDGVAQARVVLGINVKQLTPMLAEQEGLDVDSGLLVTAVVPDSIAARADVRVHDVIFSLGRFHVETLDDLAVLVQHLPTSGEVPIGIHRPNEGSGYLRLQFGSDQ